MSLFGLDPRIIDTTPIGGNTVAPTEGPTQTLRAISTPQQAQTMLDRGIAMQQAGMDYSPVGHWTQGLARVAQALAGKLEERRGNRAMSENAAYNQDLTQALMAGGGDPLAIMSDPRASDAARAAAAKVFEVRNRKPDLSEFDKAIIKAGIDPNSSEASGLYRQRANTMATPTAQFVSDGMGGGQWVVPPTGGVPASPPTAPVGKLTPVGNLTPVADAQSPTAPMTTVSRDQYNAVVAIKGKEGTDAWLSRNNIKVGK